MRQRDRETRKKDTEKRKPNKRKEHAETWKPMLLKIVQQHPQFPTNTFGCLQILFQTYT